MSTQGYHEHPEIMEQLEEFLDTYYRDEIGSLAQAYPKERRTLFVEYKDLYVYDSDLAEDFLDSPDKIGAYLSEALQFVDLPVDVGFENARVRVTDSNDYIDRHGVGDLNESDLGGYIAVECQLGKVSERKPRLKEGAFECRRCGTVTRVPQQFTESQEPGMCKGCERQGPYTLLSDQSEWVDQRKVLLEAPPEKQSSAEIIGFCIDDMADPEDVDIQEKAGSRVTVIGKLEADMSSLFGRGENEPVADEYFIPHAFVWGDNLSNDVDVDEYRNEVEEYARQDNAIELFKQNIDPSLVVTSEWQKGIEMGLVWLFAAPRIDPPGGDTIRGDIHMLMVSDPGMNKSDFAGKLQELSPKALKKDAEGMSSEVALTAAATRGGFGDESWSIEPGALPKANKGHLILDEIDKGPDGFLNGIHSPLEGDQTLEVEKAGQSATLATRCGFLALGNPVDGRFDRYENIPEQIGLHPALMSRFDLICTMKDEADKTVDGNVADGVLDSIDESMRLEYGDLDAEDAELVGGEIDRDIMKAWVKLAREEINPLLTESAKQILGEFYVDSRGMNDDETPAITARKLVAGVRIAMAYARCELSEYVEERHAERAVELSKKVIRENFDPDTGKWDPDNTTEGKSDRQKRDERIKNAINTDQMSIEEIAEETGIQQEVVESRIEKFMRQGDVMEPRTGEYRRV